MIIDKPCLAKWIPHNHQHTLQINLSFRWSWMRRRTTYMLIPDIFFFTTSPLGPWASTSYTKIPVRLWPILALSYLEFLLTNNMASTSWRLSYSMPGRWLSWHGCVRMNATYRIMKNAIWTNHHHGIDSLHYFTICIDWQSMADGRRGCEHLMYRVQLFPVWSS